MNSYYISRNHLAFIRILLLIVFFVILNASFSVSKSVIAKENITTREKGLTVAPLRSELSIAPGTCLSGEVTVKNLTNQSMTINLSAEEFSVTNPQYDYAFSSSSDVSNWVKFEPDMVTLTAGSNQIIKYTVNVPISAEPGGRYISIFASTNTKTQDTNISSLQRVGSLLYVDITGNTTRIGHMISISMPWVISDNAKWVMSLQNIGTTHFHSRYSVSVQNIFNDSVIKKVSSDSLILPNTIRVLSSELPLPRFPGLYRVVFMIGLGDTPASISTRYIIYLPTTVVVGIFVVLSLLALKYISVRKRKGQLVCGTAV